MLFKVGAYLLPFKITTVARRIRRWWAKLCGPQSYSQWLSSNLHLSSPPSQYCTLPTKITFAWLISFVCRLHGFISGICSMEVGFVLLKSTLERGKISEHGFPLFLSKREIIPFQKLSGEWVEAFGATTFGIVWVDKRYLWLVNCCLGYHRPIEN